MRRTPLGYWGAVSLGLHVAVITALLVSGAMMRHKPTMRTVGYTNLSQQLVSENRKGTAGLTVVERPTLKPKMSSRQISSVPSEITAANHFLRPKVQTISPRKDPGAPQQIRLKPPSSPLTKPSPEAKRAPPTLEAPDNNSDKAPDVSVESSGQERQAYRPFPDDKSARDIGLLSLTKTEKSVAGLSGSRIDTAFFEATPVPVENPPPTYPRSARRKGWEGEVWLQVRVADTGQVLEVRIERSSGHNILDRAALEAVQNWRFHPGRLGAKPVAGDVRVPVRFELL